MEKVKAEHADAEARTVMAYKDDFENTPEYMELTNRFITAGGEQLVERIGETHPEWDFLRYHPDDILALEDLAAVEILSNVEGQNVDEAQTTTLIIGKSPQCADPKETGTCKLLLFVFVFAPTLVMRSISIVSFS
ncbi:hypothetical protein Adt_03365 [Abeliophyllum distichum]|uniref:Uncharacterized protein n=1 Tax=Abeliophyllum distichum TaxID=126358 RepID=A0ABD1VYJ1_9LAMI